MNTTLNLHNFLSKKTILDDENSNDYPSALQFFENNISCNNVIRYINKKKITLTDIVLLQHRDISLEKTIDKMNNDLNIKKTIFDKQIINNIKSVSSEGYNSITNENHTKDNLITTPMICTTNECSQECDTVVVKEELSDNDNIYFKLQNEEIDLNINTTTTEAYEVNAQMVDIDIENLDLKIQQEHALLAEIQKYYSFEVEINGFSDIIDYINVESSTIKNYHVTYLIGENEFTPGSIDNFLTLGMHANSLKIKITVNRLLDENDTFNIITRCYLLNNNDKELFTKNIIITNNVIYKDCTCCKKN